MSSSFDISERLRIQGDDGPDAQMRARATQEQQHFTDSASSERIFCTLNGPLSTSIWVLDKRDNPTSIEPYLQLTAEGTSTWHAISQTPMTKPPVPSILVRVFALEYWEDEWLLCHRGHDYLTTVHPWLMSFRGDILEYMGLWKGKPAEEESVLMPSNFVGPLVVLGQTRGVRSWSERLRVISNLIDAVLGQQDTLRQRNLHSCVGKCQCNVLTGGAEMSSGWK
ncbi:hypothetical protein VE04_07189 [Pseudogymnoascus sp. 24MN13]|nr:hypothetical protein VE04_07189 [Pseudogymnoascus sp. 24MN13]